VHSRKLAESKNFMNKPVGGFDPESNIKFMGSALLIMLSVSLFTASHGFVRGVGKSIHPYEIAFFTSLFSFAFIYLGLSVPV